MIGIYKIENLVNDKVYIGQSLNIESRWSRHITDLSKNSHSNKHLQSAWNKYGSNAFIFTILEECDECALTEREQYWIDYYGGIESCTNYNYRDAGNGGKLSDSTKEKLRELNVGKSPWNKGLTAKTDDRVNKIAVKLKGQHISDDLRERISNTVKQRHLEGCYDYSVMSLKGIETRRIKGTVRKDKGIKRGPRDPEVGKRISEAKRLANIRKRELGLPLRNQIKKPVPTKVSVCTVCGKEFIQRQCCNKKTCSNECRRIQIGLSHKKGNVNG